MDVENYPGLLSQTGAGVVQLMRTQSRAFGMRRTIFVDLIGQLVLAFRWRLYSFHVSLTRGDAGRHGISRVED